MEFVIDFMQVCLGFVALMMLSLLAWEFVRFVADDRDYVSDAPLPSPRLIVVECDADEYDAIRSAIRTRCRWDHERGVEVTEAKALAEVCQCWERTIGAGEDQ